MEKSNDEEALKEEEVVKSGVNGLDDLFGGGFDPGSVILLAGPPGSGKSVMSAQFIYNGAVKYGEAGLYVNFSESRGDFLRNMARFGMDFNRIEEEGLFRFVDAYNVFNRRSLDIVLSHVLDELASLKVRRMVLDSINAVAAMMDKDELRNFIAATILGICKVNKVTCILISSQLQEAADIKLAELAFMCDAVINLEAKIMGDVIERFLIIGKARGKRLIASRAEYVITDQGVAVFAPIVRLPAERGQLDGYVGIGHPEFDQKVLMGGVRRGTVTLISGPGGTGKKVLLVEFAASSVLRGEKTLYVTFRDLRRVRGSFINRGYDVEGLEKKGMKFIEFSPLRVTPGIILLKLKETLDDFQPSMVVVEEVASLKWLPKEEYRRLINKMVALFRGYGVTVMMSSESNVNVRETDEFKAADNVISVWSEREGDNAVRKVCVVKMEGRPHDEKVRKLTYEEGVRVAELYEYREGVKSRWG